MGEIIRIGFLQQNAFDPLDSFNTPKKQMLFTRTLRELHSTVSEGIGKGVLHHNVQPLDLLRGVLVLRKSGEENFPGDASAWLTKVRRSLADMEEPGR